MLQASSSTSSLAKPRSLVQPRGQWQSRSSPALAHAFGLRKYAVQVKHIPASLNDRPSTAPAMLTGTSDRPASPPAVIAFNLPMKPAVMSEIDLLGGNGFWRKCKAEEEFEQRRLEEEERRRWQLKKAAEKKRREAEKAEKKRKFAIAEEQRWQEEREQKRRAEEEKERKKKDEAEKKRILREKEEEERRRRMPKTCETCLGSTQCQECVGKGQIFSIYLCCRVAPEDCAAVGGTMLEHGRKSQGCENCGGYGHNLLGTIKVGNGKCPACGGHGKIWPYLDPGSPSTSPKKNAWQA